MVLRRVVSVRPDLRVILMSATLDAALFGGYFEGAATLHIPGRTLVEEFLANFLPEVACCIPHAISLAGEAADDSRAVGGNEQ